MRRNRCLIIKFRRLICFVGLHILLLKCEGFKFPRNPNAHTLELFCNTHFYGPLVVAMNMNHVPYHLASFQLNYFDQMMIINDREKRQYPPPFVQTNSQKKNKASNYSLHLISYSAILCSQRTKELLRGSLLSAQYDGSTYVLYVQVQDCILPTKEY